MRCESSCRVDILQTDLDLLSSRARGPRLPLATTVPETGTRESKGATAMERNPEVKESGVKADDQGKSSTDTEKSSLAPVAAFANTEAEERASSSTTDLLPRIVGVVFAVMVVLLVTVFVVRRPEGVRRSAAGVQDIESVAGASHPDWLRRGAAQWFGPSRTVGSSNVKESPLASAEQGGGFDLAVAMTLLDDAQQAAAPCWDQANTDRVTLEVRFSPRGGALLPIVKDSEVVGAGASECFGREFRRFRSGPFAGQEVTLARVMERPTDGDKAPEGRVQ